MMSHRTPPKRRPGPIGNILRLSGLFAPQRFRASWPDAALAAMAAKASKSPPPHQRPVEAARAEYDRFGALLGRTHALVKASDMTVAGADGDLPARRYLPNGDILGRLVFFPGGGWVLGGVKSHDDFCRFIAAATGIEIISVAYRLAPEHAFPAAAEDAVSIGRILFDPEWWSAPATPGFFGGDSAGGNLALVAALSRPENKSDGVWLIYPSLDVNNETSLPENADPKGFGLSEDTARWFLEQYAPDPATRSHPWLNMGWSEKTDAMQAVYMGLAEKDTLCPQGQAYWARLKELNTPHKVDLLKGLPHAFIHMIGASPAAYNGALRLARGLTWLVEEARTKRASSR